jgi:hypothetical protein
MDIFRTLVVTSDEAPLARAICSTLDPVNYSNEFKTPLSPTGDEPATHYISSGGISEGFAALVPYSVWQWQTPNLDESGQWVEVEHRPGHPEKTSEMCIEAGLDVSTAAVEFLYATSDVTSQDPWTALSRLGLQLVRAPEPVEEPVDAA